LNEESNGEAKTASNIRNSFYNNNPFGIGSSSSGGGGGGGGGGSSTNLGSFCSSAHEQLASNRKQPSSKAKARLSEAQNLMEKVGWDWN
jgi:hypothetical protein